MSFYKRDSSHGYVCVCDHSLPSGIYAKQNIKLVISYQKPETFILTKEGALTFAYYQNNEITIITRVVLRVSH